MSEEVDLSFDWGGLKLAGSLHIPPGAGPHPAVLMAQGSGPADRDSGGYFGPIRQSFVSQGVATFAFDKPGCGDSTGDWRHYALEGRADQALAAIEVMRRHPAVDEKRVGIWGHSQGGWLVQKLAGSAVELAFAIASSAPTIGIQEQILHDCEQTMRSRGHNASEIGDALDLTRALQQAAIDGADFASVCAQLLQPASHQSWFASYPMVEDAQDWEHHRLLIDDGFEPLAALRRSRSPFLAVYGGRDLLLPPWRGAEESGRALTEAGSPDATIVVFPLGDHRLQDSATTDFVDGYLDLLGHWTSRRANEQ